MGNRYYTTLKCAIKPTIFNTPGFTCAEYETASGYRLSAKFWIPNYFKDDRRRSFPCVRELNLQLHK
jgi:hypothetical protein